MHTSYISLPISRMQVIMFVSYLKASITKEGKVIMRYVFSTFCVFKQCSRTGFVSSAKARCREGPKSI